MGGHLNEISYGGKVLPWGLDYNLSADALASDIIFKSSIQKIKLVTADVTLKSWLEPEDLASLENFNSDFAKSMVRDIKAWSKVQQ